MTYTIVADNTAPNGPDLNNTDTPGILTTTGKNLFSNLDETGLVAGETVITGDALFADLGDYGGPTETLPPLPGSDAIDAAGSSDPGGTDQRGFARFVNGLLDIGAVEVNPEIVIEQVADTPLVDGASSIDFGDVEVNSPSSLFFTIKNQGTANLTGLVVSKTGANASDFLIGGIDPTTLGPGESTSFGVSLTPSAVGNRLAQIQVASNDADENPFTIDLTGNGVDNTGGGDGDGDGDGGSGTDGSGDGDGTNGDGKKKPEIAVALGGGRKAKDLKAGRSKAKFGTIFTGFKGKTLKFRIKNEGTKTLKKLRIKVRGADADEFILTEKRYKRKLKPGESMVVKVFFSPKKPSTRVAVLRIISNDKDESPFDIKLRGKGKRLRQD